MGIASVLGWTRGIEGFLWLGIGIGCAVVLALAAPRRPFLHGLLTGALAGGLSPILQTMLFPIYVRNNPELGAELASSPVSPRLLFLASAPVIAALSGVVLGVLTWVLARILRRARPAAAANHG